MRIAVLGTGMVGRSIAGRLDELGHDVVVGTRDAGATSARTDPDGMGNPGYGTWAGGHPGVRLATYAEAASSADLVVNATNGASSAEVLTAAGAKNLAGTVVLDIANPLDFSRGFPPTLFVCDDDSLAEQLQRAFPRARLVKALNTMTAALMVDPGLAADGEHTCFVSGDDADAKALVVDLLHELGHDDVIDLSDITTARGTEMLLPIWVRLMATLGTSMFNIKVVR